MFGKLKLTVAAAFVRSTLNSLATDKNTQTTVAGMLAAAVLAIKGLDFGKLLAGDPQQIALVTSGLAVALCGFLATKENHDGHTTFFGVVAGASQAFIGNFTAAIALALCGYFTNKTVVTTAAPSVVLFGTPYAGGTPSTYAGPATTAKEK